MSDENCGAECVDGSPCQHPAGSCPVPSHSDPDAENPHGRPSKFPDVRNDLLDAADSFKNMEQVANAGGLKSKQTLYNYLDEYPDFLDAFKRARARAADRLIQRGLDSDDDIDMSFVRFLLERSFKFVKTERQEISGPDGGPVPVAAVPTDEQLDQLLG